VKKVGIVVLAMIVLSTYSSAQTVNKNERIADGLSVVQLRENVYQHISDFVYQSQLVECNGLIYINENEAIICDTPTNEELSKKLLEWMDKKFPSVKITAVIVNHFHADCLGGLAEFHRRGIPSYGHELSPQLLKLKQHDAEAPQHLFKSEQVIRVGNEKVVNYHFGAAHTSDNIITWIPTERTIFGGCMVKSVDAEKGNLADANVKDWPETIKAIKATCPDATMIIPGHGSAGGQELLDYTIRLFSEK
jgi:metallo-beta-lactamase class B